MDLSFLRIREYTVAQAFLLLLAASALHMGSCSKPNDPPPTGIDSTSHEFTWRIDTLGDGNPSILYDVAIIANNGVEEIWAVGEIFLKDSGGTIDPIAYGLAKWNGNAWSYKRIPVTGPTGFESNIRPRAIWAASSNEVWFAAGSVHRWKNEAMTSYWIHSFPGNPSPILADGQSAEKLWAVSSSDLYTVGTRGAIAHFDGTTWTKIESGTNVDLVDVWGRDQELWMTGVGTAESALLRLTGTATENRFVRRDSFNEVNHDSLSGFMTSLWISESDRLEIATHTGIYDAGFDTRGEARRVAYGTNFLPGYPHRIRGVDSKDVFAVGDYGMLLHWNGSSWHHYQEFTSLLKLYSVAISGNTVVAVGYEISGSRAIAIIGKRTD